MESAGLKREQPDVQKKVKSKLCIWFLMWLHNVSWRRGAHTPSIHEWPRWSFARRAIPVIISRGTSGWPGQPRHSQPPALTGPRPSLWWNCQQLGELQGSCTFCGSSPQRCHWVPSPQAGPALTVCPLTHQANEKVQLLQMCTFPKFSSLRTMWSPLPVIYSPGLYVLATYGTNFTAIFRWCNELKWQGHSHKGMATLMQTLGKAPCFQL